MKNGMPEDSGNPFGYEVRRLRASQGLTRAMLVERLVDALDERAEKYPYICEAWLEAIEQNRKLKIRRDVIEALCEALSCSLSEKAALLCLADKNVLVISEETADQFGELFHEILPWLHREAKEIVDTIPDLQAQNLTPEEKEEILGSVLELILKKRRSQG